MMLTACRRLAGVALAVPALAANAQTPFGSLGDPLLGLQPIVETYSHAERSERVVSRFVVREGYLVGPATTRARLIEQHRRCVLARPGATTLPESAFPQNVVAIRQEDYLSETSRLSVHTDARVVISPEDCSIRWTTTRKGTLGRRGTQGVCKLDYDSGTYGGGCDRPGSAYLQEPPDGRREGVAAPPVKVVAGHNCHVVSTPMADTPATPGGSACVWAVESTQRGRFPGLLSRNLFLELDYGPDNGQVAATRAQSAQPLDARLFAIPAGFTRRPRP